MIRRLWVLSSIVALLVIPVGCAGTDSSPAQVGAIQHGYASWYGANSGKSTASGERFDEGQLTAAHRHLPFGTIVRVTNERNGRSVEVRINDRGPWSGGDRIIDVSSSAADRLDMKTSGIIPVRVEVVTLPAGRT
jgi:rare lipoprotein A